MSDNVKTYSLTFKQLHFFFFVIKEKENKGTLIEDVHPNNLMS